MKLRPTTQNRPTKRESRGLSEPTRAQIQRERVQVWRRVVALPSPRPGLRRLGRDYSRDLRPSEWGSGVKLHGNNLDLPMYRVEADEGYNVRSHLMERCRLSVISAVWMLELPQCLGFDLLKAYGKCEPPAHALHSPHLSWRGLLTGGYVCEAPWRISATE